MAAAVAEDWGELWDALSARVEQAFGAATAHPPTEHAVSTLDFIPIAAARGLAADGGPDLAALVASQEALRAADRRKDEFFAVLSHELRSPLAPILAATQLLTSPQVRETQVAWAQNVIQRQVRNMVRLLDDLLDIGRISRGKLALKTEMASLNTVVDAAVEAVRPLLDRKQHRPQVSLPAPPPALCADPMRLGQLHGCGRPDRTVRRHRGGDSARLGEGQWHGHRP